MRPGPRPHTAPAPAPAGWPLRTPSPSNASLRRTGAATVEAPPDRWLGFQRRHLRGIPLPSRPRRSLAAGHPTGHHRATTGHPHHRHPTGRHRTTGAGTGALTALDRTLLLADIVDDDRRGGDRGEQHEADP